MQITTTFRQMESSPALRDYAESKVEKLEKYHHGIIDARVAFSAGKNSQTVEVTVNANGFSVRGEESAQDAYAALDLVIDKLSRQLRKQHDKIKNHKSGGNSKGELPTVEQLGIEQQQAARALATGPRITSRETYSVRPCFPDDALAQMEQSKEGFIVFVNAESGNVSTMYRKSDGNYGLVEPER